MAKLSLKAGTTSKTVNVFIFDSSVATGAGLSALTYASITGYYCIPGNAAVSISMQTLATVNSTYSSGGFKEIDATHMKGWYRFDIPDACLAAGVTACSICLTATGAAPCNLEVEVTQTDNQDVVRGGMTAMPNAASGSAGAIPTTGTGANQINVSGGRVDANLLYIDGAVAHSSTASRLANNFTTMFDVATQNFTGACYNVSGDSYALIGTKIPQNFTFASVGGTQMPQVDVRGFLGTVSAGVAGYAGIDWSHINAPATTVVFSGTTIGTLTTYTNDTPQSGDAFASLATKIPYTLEFAHVGSDYFVKVDLQTVLGTASAGAAGYVGIDWAAIHAPTTAQVLSSTTIGTLTTYTGNTPQTGDSYAIVSSGAYGNAVIKTQVGTIAGVLSGITSLGAWLKAMIRKDTADATAKSEINLVSAGSVVGLYDESHDSLEAAAIAAAANLSTSLACTNAITTQSARSGPRISEWLPRPTSGSDPNIDEVTIRLWNMAGQSQDVKAGTNVTIDARMLSISMNGNLYSTADCSGSPTTTMVKIATGIYRLWYKVTSSHAAGEVVFDFGWTVRETVNGIPDTDVAMTDSGSTVVEDAESSATLTNINSLLTNGSYGLAALNGSIGGVAGVVGHADYGNAKLVRSTTPANTLSVDASHEVAANNLPDTVQLDIETGWGGFALPTAFAANNLPAYVKLDATYGWGGATLPTSFAATTVNGVTFTVTSGGLLHASGGGYAWTYTVPPTAAENRTEMDSNSSQLASLVSGVTLSATQSLYAPSKAGDKMDLVNAPNGTAITAIQSGLAMASSLGTLAAKLTGITSLVKILQGLFRKDIMDVTAKNEINDGGGTYNEATDSNEAQADRNLPLTAQQTADALKLQPAGGAPASGSVYADLDALQLGGGAWAVPITVTDGVNPVPHASVRLTTGRETWTGVTDSDGHVAFSLDDDVYSLRITAPGHSYTPTTRTVDGADLPLTEVMTVITVTTSNDPLSTAFMTIIDSQENPIPNITVTFRMMEPYPSTPGYAYDTTDITATSDASGLVQIPLIRRGRYKAKGNAGSWSKVFAVTSTDTFPIPPINIVSV